MFEFYKESGTYVLELHGYERSLENPSVSGAETFLERCVKGPVLKCFALMRNTRGMKDVLIRLGMIVRLRFVNRFRR